MTQALIIVDIQNDYFPGGRMELVGANEAAGEAARLLRAFREHGAPVFHIQHVSTRPGATFFLPDTEGVKIHESVAPLPSDKFPHMCIDATTRSAADLGFECQLAHDACATRDLLRRIEGCGAGCAYGVYCGAEWGVCEGGGGT